MTEMRMRFSSNSKRLGMAISILFFIVIGAWGCNERPFVQESTDGATATTAEVSTTNSSGPLNATATSASSSGSATSVDEGSDTGSVPGDACVENHYGEACPRPQGSGGSCTTWSDDCSLGSKCTVGPDTGSPLFECLGVAPRPKALYEACSTFPDWESTGIYDDCDRGLMCYRGSCIALATCSEDFPMCSDPESLVVSSHGVGYCFSRCDPFAPDCSAGLACTLVYSDLDSASVFACAGFSEKTEGMECVSSDCGDSMVCQLAAYLAACDYPACCTRLCDTTNPASCADSATGDVCIPISNDVICIDTEVIGLCEAG